MVIKLNKLIVNQLFKPVSIAPIGVFRILFGLMMFISTLRFMLLGWIDEHFIQPIIHFTYFGFEWINMGPDWTIYAVHVIMLFAALGIMLGWYYRLSSLFFFLTFTYTELIDASFYLNHYYFVSLICLLLITLPANKFFSLDVAVKKVELQKTVPLWNVFILQFQIAVVYIGAGLAKINSEWLIDAMPLRIWLPANDQFPIIGFLFTKLETAYVFSWFGMLYDCFIVFFLSWKRTRIIAFISVLTFHLLTGALFQIGIFPLVMIVSSTLFFDSSWHEKMLDRVQKGISLLVKMTKKSSKRAFRIAESRNYIEPSLSKKRLILSAICLYVLVQIAFPFRFLLYPGHVLWTEQGYRFSWRVMLVEKSGSAQFYVIDSETGKKGVVNNTEFLTLHQEKQMSFQPDLIIQFAHFLAKYYQTKGVKNPKVTAEVYVSLNARPSELLFDSNMNLLDVNDTWKNKDWIINNPL